MISPDYRSFANYLDPVFKGVHLEALEGLKETKKDIMARWGENVPEDTVLELGAAALSPDLVDPTALLLRARQSSGELITKERETKIQREMSFYESTDLPMRLDELSTNGDRLQWWKKHEVILPTLAKAAKEILSIPCSSSKSERVFSTGGQVICLLFHSEHYNWMEIPSFGGG